MRCAICAPPVASAPTSTAASSPPKEHPGDFDACWDLDGVDFDVIDEVLLTFDAGRRAQKAKYRGEMFPADAAADPLGTLFRDFFQRDRDGNPKGIIVIDLEDFQ